MYSHYISPKAKPPLTHPLGRVGFDFARIRWDRIIPRGPTGRRSALRRECIIRRAIIFSGHSPSSILILLSLAQRGKSELDIGDAELRRWGHFMGSLSLSRICVTYTHTSTREREKARNFRQEFAAAALPPRLFVRCDKARVRYALSIRYRYSNGLAIFKFK